MAERILVGDVEYELSSLTTSLGFLTRVIQVQINERVRTAGALQVTPAIFTTLQLIQANPGIRQVHASRILVIQESNMASLVKDLIARGLIERREDEGKRIGLWITAQGEEELERSSSSDNLERVYASALSDREYRQLMKLLDRVYRKSLGQG